MCEGGQLLSRSRLLVQNDQRRAPGRLTQQRRDPACMAGIGGDHEPAGVAMATLAQLT